MILALKTTVHVVINECASFKRHGSALMSLNTCLYVMKNVLVYTENSLTVPNIISTKVLFSI